MPDLVVFWLIGAVIVAAVAKSRGRDGLGWFFLAIIISPVLAFAAVAAMPAVQKAPSGPMKACPRCAEQVKAAATTCRHCGFEFAPPGSRLGRYGEFGYMVAPDGSVHRVVQGQPMAWPNEGAFRAWINSPGNKAAARGRRLGA